MSEPTFTISEDGKAITCHRCGRTSHNANDVAFHYCGRCNHWHEGANLLGAETEVAFLDNTQVIARLIARTMPDAKFFLTIYRSPDGGKVGVDKYGVSIATNVPRTDLLKLLRSIISHAEDAAEVVIKTE
jgi:hypothetical protein